VPRREGLRHLPDASSHHCGHGRVSFPTSAPARVAVTQIKLTQKHVEGCIAAQKDMSAVVEKMMQGAVFSNSANARYEAELKAVTKKHSFKNFAEYEAVTASVSLVMAAIDSHKGVYRPTL
jgi:hypothetical protein